MYSFYDGQVLKTLGKDTKRTTGPGYYGERVDDAEEFIERNKDNHNLAWLIPDGRFILDVDNHKGSVGSESLGRLKEDYDLPLIKSVTTAGGGEHYYCRLPDLFTGKLMHKIPGYPGLELLREGQTVVIPPSKIGRKKYTLHSTTLNELPQEILDKCTKAEFIDDGEEVPEEQREAVLSYVRRLIPYVSIEDYMDWWGVGNALKSLGDKAFPLFHDWSRTQVGYVDRNDCKEHWVKEMKEEGSYKFIEFLAWNRVCEKLINNIHTFVEIDGNKKNVDWGRSWKIYQANDLLS